MHAERYRVAQLVHQPRGQRGLGGVPAIGAQQGERIGQIITDACRRACLADIVQPVGPDRFDKGFIGGARLRGLAGLGEGFHCALEGADAVDMRFHAQPVDQTLEVEATAARSGHADHAERIEPYFGGVGGQHVAGIVIIGGTGEHRLAGSAHLVERCADSLHGHLTAAAKSIEIEHDGLDRAVVGCRLNRPDHVAQAILARAASAREHGILIEGARLLDDGTIERQIKRAA